jgi:hypothetical protein
MELSLLFFPKDGSLFYDIAALRYVDQAECLFSRTASRRSIVPLRFRLVGRVGMRTADSDTVPVQKKAFNCSGGLLILIVSFVATWNQYTFRRFNLQVFNKRFSAQ